ncbi:Ppx/GppA family phosphatase [Balneolaceae bacterium YR4-1]|uniref:Ppx/GppA family phosphatase n=1 Tax=Halalkalibaculum roseum TaxID=2709311 RepID=A0A6M1SN65_9BACT|nr:Ppx/GppA family phosphatase [Halalkalibaculum roseum]
MHAAIDIGTNTVLLLVAKKNGEILTPVREEQRIPRLGNGVDASGNLSDASMKRVLDALQEYNEIISSDYPQIQSPVVTATSAVRDAANRSYFIDKVREETGFEIRLLSGIEEAEYTFAGALSMLPKIDEAVVIDIGGGSTEIAHGMKGVVRESHSFDMGSVRFTERFIGSDPPEESQIRNCREEIRKILHNRPFKFQKEDVQPALVGVAGTVTSLAFMDSGLSQYDSEQINDYTLSTENISYWVDKISKNTVRSLEETYPVVMKGRAEIILAGLLILDEFMTLYNFPELVVSTGGIRHGAILSKN